MTTTHVLDGARIHGLRDFRTVIGEAVGGPGGYFGGNLDALNDCLRGGFGTPDDGSFVFEWRHHAVSREALGHPGGDLHGPRPPHPPPPLTRRRHGVKVSTPRSARMAPSRGRPARGEAVAGVLRRIVPVRSGRVGDVSRRSPRRLRAVEVAPPATGEDRR